MSASTRFYNMTVHLLHNNRIYEENVAIKDVLEKEGNIFLDIYFYNRQKSYIFDSAFIHDIYDISTEKLYRNIKDFIKDFYAEKTETKDASVAVAKNIHDNKIIGHLKSELTILTFIANCCGYYSTLKEKIIIEYISAQSTQAQNLSKKYLETYIKTVNPDSKDFYEAFKNLDYKNPDKIDYLCQEALKVCVVDGRLHYTEKVYMAEMLQIIRAAGINVDLAL
ncbi:MAG: hypothetical protein E7012_06895 [Alphaproteobacteria bacterium]|nr:hypothetical protein [Alphaproteobacteria bacterium]